MDLKGLRVLVVEDQALIAMNLQEILIDCGCVVVGPVGTLEAAVRLARTAELDVAILDVALHNDNSFPVASDLQARGIPFCFSTGYGEAMLPKEWRSLPVLMKPFTVQRLEEVLRKVTS